MGWFLCYPAAGLATLCFLSDSLVTHLCSFRACFLLSLSSLTHGVTYFPGSASAFWFPDSDGHSPPWHRTLVDRYLGIAPPWHGLGVSYFSPHLQPEPAPPQPKGEKKKNDALPALMGLVLGWKDLFSSTARFIFVLRTFWMLECLDFFLSLWVSLILPFFSYLQFHQKSWLFQIYVQPV